MPDACDKDFVTRRELMDSIEEKKKDRHAFRNEQSQRDVLLERRVQTLEKSHDILILTQQHVNQLMNDLKEIKSGVSEGFKDVKEELKSIHTGFDVRFKDLDAKYVSGDKFAPVQQLVYGLVGAIVISIIGAIVKIIFFK